ncbi:MAG: hypothetical protein VB878_12040 [Pirellulaceae bacterium]
MTHRLSIFGTVPVGLVMITALCGCFGKSKTPVTLKSSSSSDDTSVVSHPDTDTQEENGAHQGQETNNDADDSAGELKGGDDANPRGTSDPNAGNLPEVPESTSASNANEPPGGESEIPQIPQRPDDLGRERICVLTDTGPLLIDLWLSIDGIAHREAFATLVNESLRAADADGDGKPTWDELTSNDQFRYGRTGNLEIETDSERRELIRMYDSDRDGTVDRDELPRFLTRNAGGSRPFSLRSSNYYRDINRTESPLRQLLDVNRDGVIDADERRTATTTLRSRDANQDDILIPSEFRIATVDAPVPLTVNRPSQPDSAIWLAEVRQWRNFLFTLEERYALGRSLEPGHFSAVAALFSALDENGDETIDGKEIIRINDVDPHIILVARFGKPRLANEDGGEEESAPDDVVEQENASTETADGELEIASGTATDTDNTTNSKAQSLPTDAGPESGRTTSEKPFELIYVAAGILSDVVGDPDAGNDPMENGQRLGVIEQPRRITLFLANTVLILFSNDAAGESPLGARAAAPFQQLDADNNGYLEEEEIPGGFAGLPSFAALDRDEDGKVFPEEIERFFEMQQTAWRKQVRSRAGEAGDALFTLLDGNDDGRLTTREIESAGARLAAFDRDNNGLSVSEIPNVMLLGIVRGDPQSDDNSFQQGLVAPPSRPKSELPDWFLGMDRNDDLDLSRREFLGDDQQFAELDRNGDGFIAPDELDAGQ